MQYSKLSSGLSLIFLVGSTLAKDVRFYSAYNCRGSSVSCQAFPPDLCCTQDSPVFAFSGRVQYMGWKDIGSLYLGNGGSLGNCDIVFSRGAIGTDVGCSTAQPGSFGVSGGSYHTDFSKRDGEPTPTECKGKVSPNMLSTFDGEGEWHLRQGDITDEDFAVLLNNFTALPAADHKEFLVSQGAVHAPTV